jgi:hypothetical protein
MTTKSEENKQVSRHLYIALGRGNTDTTSPGADVKASKVAGTNSPRVRVAVTPDTAAREKAVMTRLMLATLSGLISPFSAICSTVIYPTVLEWRYCWLAVCVAGFVAMFVFLWKACELFYGTNKPGSRGRVGRGNPKANSQILLMTIRTTYTLSQITN